MIYLNGEDESDAAAWINLYWETVDSRPTLVGAEVHRPTGPSTSVITQSVQYFHLVEVDSALRVKSLEVSGGLLTSTWSVVQDFAVPAADIVPSADLGTEGDLVQVVRRIAVSPGEPGTEWRSIVTQYRYHDGELVREEQGEGFDIRLDVLGLPHQLKSVFNPQQVEYVAQRRSSAAPPTDTTLVEEAIALLELDDDATAFSDGSGSALVMEAAAKILDYSGEVANALDPSQTDSPVTAQILQAGDCGCGGGTVSASLLTYGRFDWTINPQPFITQDGSSMHIREHALGSFGAWPTSGVERTRCIDLLHLDRGAETFPYVWLRATIQGDVSGSPLGRAWVTGNQYDSTTHAKLGVRTASAFDVYTPAAPTGGGAGTGPAVTVDDAAGLFIHYSYDGEHVGERKVGTFSDPKLVEKVQYVSDGNESRRGLIDEHWGYRVAGSTNANDQEHTQFGYGFETAGSSKLDWRSVTVERELVGENGPGTSDVTSWEFFDDRGQRVLAVDPEGTVTRFEHDPLTGVITRVTRNYFAPSGNWTTAIPDLVEPSPSPLPATANSDGTLVTEVETDLMGRVTKVTRPGGVESWTVRRMAEDAGRPGILYYSTVTLPHQTSTSPATFSGPARARWMDAASEVTKTESWSLDTAATYDPDSQVYTPDEVIARSVMTIDLGGGLSATKVWWNVAEDLAYEETYTYDAFGRLTSVLDGTGTETSRTYDVLDRIEEVQVGRPSEANGTAQVVARYYYDGDPSAAPAHGVGNGNLTHLERFDGAGTRLSRMYYDHRDRLIATVSEDEPMSVTVFDNLDRPIESAIYPEPGTVPSLAAVRAESAAGGLPEDGQAAFGQSAAFDRSWYTKTSYSQRGLVYKEQVAIDPAAASPGYLEWNWWYDEDGLEIASWAPDSPGTITSYDAHHRTVRSVLTDRAGDSDDPLGTAGRFTEATRTLGDTVLEETEYRYATGSGVLDLITHRARHHEASLPGDPDDDEYITSYSGKIYDSALRPIASIDFGTNKAAFGVTAATAPVLTNYDTLAKLRAATDVLFAWTEYDVRGRVGSVIGMQEGVLESDQIRTSYVYDDLGRTAAVIENAVSATVSWDDVAGRYAVAGLSTSHPDRDRVTSFVYDAAGNVVRRVAHLPAAIGQKFQETSYSYGTIVGSAANAMDSLVASGRLLASIHYPHEVTGVANTGAEYTVSYAYNRLGELRGMTDQNGTVREFERDAAGRTTADTVETPGTYSVFGSSRGIDESVMRLEYGYDTLGRLAAATSLESDLTTIRDQVELGYTPLWQIETIAQQHDGAVSGTSPMVSYSYQSAAPSTATDDYHAGNYSRLSEIAYPTDGGNATAQYAYGAGTDSLVGRAASISVEGLGGAAGMKNLAAYERIGLGMTAKVTIAPTGGDYQPVLDRTRELDGDGPSGVYPAYDRFGRLTTHMWVRDDFGPGVSGFANGTPMLAVTHTYDRSSNRLSAHDARAGAKLPLRERGFSYDQLHRLIEEDRTPLPASSTYASQHRSLQWDLDMLGNWDTLFRDGDEDGDFADLQGDEHVDGRNHNAANEIQSNALVSDPNYDREVISTGSASWYHQHRYDDAGNMTDQRTSTLIPAGSGAMPGLRMAYDAWNRLVTTEHTGSGSTKDVSAYTYNALGWRTTKAFDASQGAYDGVMEQKRVFIYDASWRVIEEHIDIDADTSAGTDWISQQFWGLRYIDDLVAKRVDRDADADWLDAESTSWYFITDSQFSVSAVLNQDRHLWERVEYDAYGKARHRYAGDVTGDGRYNFFDLSALGGESALGDPNSDYHADFDVNFDGDILLTSGASADRDLDVINGRAGAMGTALPDGWISSPSASSGPDNSIGYAGYVHNPEREDYTVRFRVYAPELGRWRTRDPAGYVDGGNELAYVRGEPTFWFDPLGLEVHHIYPLYLGGAPGGVGIDLEHDAHMSGAHRSIRNQLGGGTHDRQRRAWARLSNSERQSILKQSLIDAGADEQTAGRLAEDAIDQSGNTPGVNNTNERKNSSTIYNSDGKIIKAAKILGALSIIGAVGDAMAASNAIDQSQGCGNMKKALRKFVICPTDCNILRDGRKHVEACALDIGTAIGGPTGLTTWSQMIDAYDNLLEACKEGSN